MKAKTGLDRCTRPSRSLGGESRLDLIWTLRPRPSGTAGEGPRRKISNLGLSEPLRNAQNALEVAVRASWCEKFSSWSWRNWQTRMLEVHVPERVWSLSPLDRTKMIGDCCGARELRQRRHLFRWQPDSTSRLRFGHRREGAASPIPKRPERQDARFSRTFGARSRA